MQNTAKYLLSNIGLVVPFYHSRCTKFCLLAKHVHWKSENAWFEIYIKQRRHLEAYKKKHRTTANFPLHFVSKFYSFVDNRCSRLFWAIHTNVTIFRTSTANKKASYRKQIAHQQMQAF